MILMKRPREWPPRGYRLSAGSRQGHLRGPGPLPPCGFHKKKVEPRSAVFEQDRDRGRETEKSDTVARFKVLIFRRQSRPRPMHAQEYSV